MGQGGWGGWLRPKGAEGVQWAGRYALGPAPGAANHWVPGGAPAHTFYLLHPHSELLKSVSLYFLIVFVCYPAPNHRHVCVLPFGVQVQTHQVWDWHPYPLHFAGHLWGQGPAPPPRRPTHGCPQPARAAPLLPQTLGHPPVVGLCCCFAAPNHVLLGPAGPAPPGSALCLAPALAPPTLAPLLSVLQLSQMGGVCAHLACFCLWPQLGIWHTNLSAGPGPPGAWPMARGRGPKPRPHLR